MTDYHNELHKALGYGDNRDSHFTYEFLINEVKTLRQKVSVYEDGFINGLAKTMYENAAAHGFHDSDKTNPGRFAEYIANLHGELSELFEVYRKNKMNEQCDKQGLNLTNAEEEIADIFIRAMDTAFALGIDIDKSIRLKHEYNKSRSFMHGKIC